MRYNETDGEEINGRIVIKEEIDSDSIFENSCIVIDNIQADRVRANYDLCIIGDADIEKLEVAGNFSCIGNCKVGELAIQGSCLVDGNLTVDHGFVGDELTAKEICAESLDVKGSISCVNLECNADVSCEKSVLISEGLMGGGSLASKIAICGEYSMLEDAQGVVVADSISSVSNTGEGVESGERAESIDLDEWKLKEKRLNSKQFYEELCALAERDERFKSESSAYKKLLVMENAVTPPSIKVYVDMLDMLSRKFQIISKTKLYAKVKVKFQSWTYEDINNTKMSSISQKDFAKMLHILTYKPELFDENIRHLILETLFILIGVDYEDVCNTLEEK